MTTRHIFVAATVAMISLGLLCATVAKAAEEAAKETDFLFVQNAKNMSFDSSTNKLTLEGVSPVTVFFSDRPERIAGSAVCRHPLTDRSTRRRWVASLGRRQA